MRILLDTHVFLWLADSPGGLSATAASIVTDNSNEVFLSIVSIWELQIKVGTGKLDLSVPLRQMVREQTDTNNIQALPIEADHIYALEGLPQIHKDPFDRLLIAQSIAETLPLLSSYSKFSGYPATVIW